MNEIFVEKRNGDKEPLNYDKINTVLLWATEGISGVNASEIAMNAKLQLFNGITTEEIHKILIRSAADLISHESINYQFVASKLTNYLLRKNVFNTYNKFPRFKDFIKQNIDRGVYNKNILEKYSEREIDKIENYIKHSRDEELTYAGIQQLIDKYLIKNRETGEIYETPQFLYMCFAMSIYADIEDASERRKQVKELYDQVSQHHISLSTPVLAGVRTQNTQFSSCVLIDVADDLESIGASNHSVLRYISNRAGIGLNFRLRAEGSSVNNGEKVHTGIVPFIKMFEASVKSCSQGGIRGGAATAYYPFWHYEIEDILVLKNNAGNDLNRVRRLDHAIQFCKLFYKRFIANEDITLFSPHDVPDLYDAFGKDNDLFEELYEKYERSYKIRKKKVKARTLMNSYIKERIETGRMYLQNIDNVNANTPFKEKISMSNLCTEINLHTSPQHHINDGEEVEYLVQVKKESVADYMELKYNEGLYLKMDGSMKFHSSNLNNIAKIVTFEKDTEKYKYFIEKVEHMYGDKPAEIALCVLSALNLGKIKNWDDLRLSCYHAVRTLDRIIEVQDYIVHAATKMKKRRSIGVGVTNLAYWIAKQGLRYDSTELLPKLDELFERIQFYLIQASVELSKEYGPCEWFDKTHYSDGIMPVDRYNKKVDGLTNRPHTMDWDSLREDVLKYGMRNTTLSAIMPCESSSLVSSSTNGIEPIVSLITYKISKAGAPLPVVVPEFNKLKNKYQLAKTFANSHMNDVVSVIQKWIDQGISVNHYYNKENFEDGELPVSEVAKDILRFYQYGGKQLYYANSKDVSKTGDYVEPQEDGLTEEEIEQLSECEGGACSI